MNMKRKFTAYLSLFVLISSILTTPFSTVAAVAEHTMITEETKNQVYDEEEVKPSIFSEDASSQISEESLENADSLDKTESEITQSSEMKQLTENQSTALFSTLVKAVQTNVITSMVVTDKDGNSLDHAVGQWENFRINATFSLPNGQVSEGDTTTITLPSEFRFGDTTSFELKDANGNIVAHAVIDSNTKTVVLTYTNYAETHSDITGSFFFYAGVDTAVVNEEKTITTNIDVEGTVFPVEIDFEGIDNHDYPISKAGWFMDNSENEIQYYVAINRVKQAYPNVVVSDLLKNEGVTYAPGTFKIYKGEWERNAANTDWVLADRVDVTSNYTIDFSSDNQSFSIDFGNIGEDDQFAIYYIAKVAYTPVQGELFVNTAVLASNEQVIQTGTANTDYQKGGGQAEGYNFMIKIHKENEDGQSLAGAEFEVVRDSSNQVLGTIVTDVDGNGKIDGLLRDEYTIKETKAPSGYVLSTEEIKISSNDFGSDLSVLKTIINRKIEEPTIEISGIKTWNDADNQDGKRPDSITVNLLADGEQVDSKQVTEADGWLYKFTDLPKYKEGTEIVYTITENQIPDYNTEINGFDITNHYTPGRTSVSVTKHWKDADNQEGKRPNSIQVQLLADGKKKGDTIELNKANNWTTTWNNLAQKADGKDVVYTIEEVSVPGYTAAIDDTDKGNILLTNIYTPETISINGMKTWNDANNQDGKRPDSIIVNLLADGKQVDSRQVTKADNWSYEFTNLPKYKGDTEIVYTITENQVDNYITKIDGFNIINTYSPGNTSGTVTKHWDDANDKDGIRPNSIRIQLYANGKKHGEPVRVTEKNNWTYTWEKLKICDQDGKAIQYEIKEVGVAAGYTATITGNNLGNLLITNTHSINKTIKNIPITGDERNGWAIIFNAGILVTLSGSFIFKKKKDLKEIR
jgi:serine-aspartate repeat-containing protein C/D/E